MNWNLQSNLVAVSTFCLAKSVTIKIYTKGRTEVYERDNNNGHRKSFCKAKTQCASTHHSRARNCIHVDLQSHNLWSQEWSAWVCAKPCLHRMSLAGFCTAPPRPSPHTYDLYSLAPILTIYSLAPIFTPWPHTYNFYPCLLYTSPSPRDQLSSRMPSSA